MAIDFNKLLAELKEATIDFIPSCDADVFVAEIELTDCWVDIEGNLSDFDVRVIESSTMSCVVITDTQRKQIINCI